MSVTDIMLTGAKLWYGPVGEALPDANTIGEDADWGGNWIALGELGDPLSLVEETEVAEHGQQRMAPVRRSRKKQVFSFKSSLIEVNAANRALVRGYNPGTVVTNTPAGASQVGLDLFDPNQGTGCARVFAEWVLAAEGIMCTPNDTIGFERIYITKGNFMSDGDVVYDQNSDEVKLPFTFKALWNAAHAKGIAFMMQRKIANATS